MSATAVETDQFEWIEAVGTAVETYPDDLTMNDLLAAYGLIGVKTTLNDMQTAQGLWHLETYGFLRVDRTRRSRPRYSLTIPDEIVTDAELAAGTL
ncbi:MULTISPECIES: hypothetical protein [Mycolicibacterium]|uniref:hypothetical protein n=1 Tax=Mycolicibacterium TaxID=1866885 RepID=UPI000AB824F3|nr:MULTISPECIES: hypothetical protein [Mycolicibacterium]QZY48323.1 hypothetical protein K5L12_11890 [Mycolicibacterium austroafricanum]WND58964.1 hypothetical protein QQA43_11565 [Mycolicibacterium vanbaalenii]